MILAVLLVQGCGRSDPPAPVVNMGVGGGSSAGIHTVMEGDNLWSIANRYRLSMRDVISVNRLAPPYRLDVGDRLQLPAPREYKVKRGDTLYEVARMFDVSLNRLTRLNRMKAPYTIHENQVLRLPSSSRQTTPVSRMAKATKKPAAKPRSSSSLPKSVKPPPRSSGRFLRPVSGRVISRYGPKKGGMHNDGINIAAARGTQVKAAENGVVAYVGDELAGYGNLILIRHENRWMTAYGHLQNTAIKRGQTVKKGQVIGTVGSSGSVDRPQLHFEIRRGSKALNPEKHI